MRYLMSLLVVGLLLGETPVFAQQLSVTLTDSEGNPLPDAVIELVPSPGVEISPDSSIMVQVDQVDKEFVPTVTAIPKGGKVSFPNSDDILHHVYSFSPARTFNIPLYGMGENDNYFETFDSTGLVEIGCNIHDWMLAYIYVAESDFTAISDERGIALIDGIAPGTHEVRIWHSRMDASTGPLTRQENFEQGQTVEISMSLELQRDRRVRRAPTNNRNRYR